MKKIFTFILVIFVSFSCEESDETLIESIEETPTIGGNKKEEETNGYLGVKNISHSKLMGNVYGNLTRFRLNLYADGNGLDECGCSACNNNFQFDFKELYFNPSSRSIKFKKEGDTAYQYKIISSDRSCVRYTED